MNRAFPILAGFIFVLGSETPTFAQSHNWVVAEVRGNHDSHQVEETTIQLVTGRHYGGYRGGHFRSHRFGNYGGHRYGGYRGGHFRSHGYRNYGGHYRSHGYGNYNSLHLYNFYSPYYLPYCHFYSGGHSCREPGHYGYGNYKRLYRGYIYGPYLCPDHEH